jgi:DNA-binding transcriptional ArsR family regulator
MRPTRDEVEGAIFQALSSGERREILRVIASRTGGTSYSEILGELGLTTGNLNYHLKQLEGFLRRDDERLYTLTPLGERAVAVLAGSLEEGKDYGEYIDSARLSQSMSIHPVVVQLIRGAIVFDLFILAVWSYLGYIMLTEGGAPPFVWVVLAFLLAMGFVALVYLIKALVTAPEYVRRLERRLGLTR